MSNPPSSLPKEFIEQVKSALEHLYDFAYLQQLPLARQLEALPTQGSRPSASTPSSGHQLRRALITAIEAIDPGSGVQAQSPDARIFTLMQMRYIDDLTVQVAANRLGLSSRQAHRLLRRGEESVATLLWLKVGGEETISAEMPPAPAESESSARELSSVQSEIALLDPTLEPVDMQALVRDALAAIAPLADARGLPFRAELPDDSVMVSTDSAVARQVLMSLLSRVLTAADGGMLNLKLTSQASQTVLSLSFLRGDSAEIIVDDVISQLVAKLGWTLRQEPANGGQTVIRLNMTGAGALVLVIDDNEGLVQMLDRFLTGHHCRVVTTTSGEAGLELAQELIPDAIILDVMIPGKSGWEILQLLRGQPHTAAIPIVVCSVFNDPDLATALGATRFHSKPISRDEILNTLRELNVV